MGFAASNAKKDELASIIFRQLIGPEDGELLPKLEKMHSCLLSKIPNLPDASKIAQLVVVIYPDLTATAYVDELPVKAKVKPNRPVVAGESVYLHDICQIDDVDLGIDVPVGCAFVIVNSFQWKRSLFFDFGPLHQEIGPRDYQVGNALAQQLHLLYGLPAPQPMFEQGKTRLQSMSDSLAQFRKLISARCPDESEYQRLFEGSPWLLGASYCKVDRHSKLDDRNIPDFTATRAYDHCHDVVELKQPFLPIFRENDSFSSAFNDAWNQAERYLDFCFQQRSYLLEQKDLRFENPRCLLLIGNNLTSAQLRSIRVKERANRLVTVMTYDQLLDQADHVYSLIASAGERLPLNFGN